MNRNMLKLLKNKTNFIVFSSKQHINKIENLCIKVGISYINSSMSVGNHWHMLDNTL